MYYPLHVHSSIGSIGDSILDIPSYLDKLSSMGIKAAALTDHGSMAGLYRLTEECKKRSMKPIYGCEVYTCEDIEIKDKIRYHLLLLAKTDEGLKNLFKLQNLGATEGFYYKPRVDWKMIEKYGKGIICLTACVAGEIPKKIIAGDIQGVVDTYNKFIDYFDDVCLEIQPGNFEEQRKVNEAFVALSKQCGIPLVVTNDVHYLNKEDYLVHDYHVKLNRKSNETALIYPDKCYFVASGEQILSQLEYLDSISVFQALKNTERIVESIDAHLEIGLNMPKFCDDEDDVLELKCLNALEEYNTSEEYRMRLQRELNVIREKGFSGYFLIVQDYINFARENNIPIGPGRGSGAGSLVSFLLGISQADPIKYGLLFERFLDPARAAVPDIDVDMSPSGRDRIFEYVKEKYGADCCALVSTIAYRKAKGAVHDAARLLGLSAKEGTEIAKLIPSVYYGDDNEKTVDMPIKEAREKIDELKNVKQKVLDVAEKLEGLPVSSGIHAAGIIISPHSLLDRIPLIKSNKEGILATALNLTDAEKSYVKFDFLSLANLDVIAQTEKDCGIKIDYRNIDYSDSAVWDLIGSENTTGLFQISSVTYKKRMPRLKPKSLLELATCLALVRGPSIAAKTDEKYMRILEKKDNVESVHEIYDEITKDTLGVLVFQEQTMKIAVGYGLTLSDGYAIVKSCAKKKIDLVHSYREKFIESALKLGASELAANSIFDLIEASSLYSFNLSHALSYAMITYATAWLKVYHTKEFMKNVLSNAYERDKEDEYASIIKDCDSAEIEFLPPDIRHSRKSFVLEQEKIRVGLVAKGIGDKAIDILVGTKINSWDDFISVVENNGRILNKKVVTSLIFAGYLDCFENNRVELYQRYLNWRKEKDPIPETIKISSKIEVHPYKDNQPDLEKLFFGAKYVLTN